MRVKKYRFADTPICPHADTASFPVAASPLLRTSPMNLLLSIARQKLSCAMPALVLNKFFSNYGRG
jgi:hypothetical protein